MSDPSRRRAHPYGRSADDVRRRNLRVQRARRSGGIQLAAPCLIAVVSIAGASLLVRLVLAPEAPSSADPSATAPEQPGAEGGKKKAAPQCPPKGAVPLAPDKVQVTVMNGTSERGLAGKVSKKLAKRGYKTGTPGNVKSVDAAYTVVHGPQGYLAAQSVAAQFTEVTIQMDENLEGPGVKLLIGKGNTDLVPAEDAQAHLQDPVPTPEWCPAS